MGYPTKVQLIKRQASEQWYINFPSAVAQAMEFVRGEFVEWIIEDKSQLVLRRRQTPPSAVKKTARDSLARSTNTGNNAATLSPSSESPSGRRRSR